MTFAQDVFLSSSLVAVLRGLFRKRNNLPNVCLSRGRILASLHGLLGFVSNDEFMPTRQFLILPDVRPALYLSVAFFLVGQGVAAQGWAYVDNELHRMERHAAQSVKSGFQSRREVSGGSGGCDG